MQKEEDRIVKKRIWKVEILFGDNSRHSPEGSTSTCRPFECYFKIGQVIFAQDKYEAN